MLSSLQPAWNSAVKKLTEFSSDARFESQIRSVFGNDIETDIVRNLLQNVVEGEDIPTIAILPAAEINGANGTFAAENNTIYLAQEYLESNDSENVSNLLLEELGHYIDWRLNETDSPEDEGAIFSALVRGENLSKLRLQQLKAEDDFAITAVDGEEIAIEQQENKTKFPIRIEIVQSEVDGYAGGNDFRPNPLFNRKTNGVENKKPQTLDDIKYEDRRQRVAELIGNNNNRKLEEFLRSGINTSIKEENKKLTNTLVDLFLDWESDEDLNFVTKENNTLTELPNKPNTLRHNPGSILSEAVRLSPEFSGGFFSGNGIIADLKELLKEKIRIQNSSTGTIDLSKISLTSPNFSNLNYSPSIMDGLFRDFDILTNTLGGIQGRAAFLQDFKTEIIENSGGKTLKYKADLQLVLYDDFGTDDTDIYGSRENFFLPDGVKGLDSQWILQHFRGARPFVNEVVIEDFSIEDEGIELVDDFKLDDIILPEDENRNLTEPIRASTEPGFGEETDIFYRIVVENEDNLQEIKGKLTSDSSELEVVELPPLSRYTAAFYQPSTNLSSVFTGISAEAGEVTAINNGFIPIDAENIEFAPPIKFHDFGGQDSDGYLVPDVGEFVIGTDPNNIDSDLDGITDDVEIANGSASQGTLLVDTLLDPIEQLLTEIQNNINDKVFGGEGLLNTGNGQSLAGKNSLAAKGAPSTLLPIFGDILKNTEEAQFAKIISNRIREKFTEKFGEGEEAALSEIQSTLFEVFGPGGLFGEAGILEDSNDDGKNITEEDIQIAVSEETGIEFDFDLGGKQTFDADLPTDIGLPWLGLELDESSAGVDLDYDFNFGFDIDPNGNFSFDTSPKEDVSISLTPSLPEAKAKLGFLQVTAATTEESGINFALDFKDDDDKLTTSEFDSLQLVPSGNANLGLDIETGINDFDNDLLASLPKLSTEFGLDWDFTADGGVPQVEFGDVSLDLGSFFAEFAAPILKNLFLRNEGENVEFFTYQTPEFGFGFDFESLPIPVFGPIVLNFIGAAKASAQFKFGFDTKGLVDFANNDFKEPKLIADGLFVSRPNSDSDGENDDDNLSLQGLLGAAAGVDVGVASASVGGGISLDIGLGVAEEIEETNGQIRATNGKIRASDIATQPPLCLFDFSGALSAIIFASIRVGFGFFGITKRFEFANINLIDFNIETCDKPIEEYFDVDDPKPTGELAEKLVEQGLIIRDGTDGDDRIRVTARNGEFPQDLRVTGLDPEPIDYNKVQLIVIDGGQGDNIIELEADVRVDSQLEGGAGNDSLIGGQGLDFLTGGAGNDTLDGGNGDPSNTAVYADAPDGVVVDLNTNTAQDGFGTTDTLANINNIEGSKSGDTLIGNANSNVLDSGDGDDNLSGGAGDDVLLAGLGADTINGGSGQDTTTYLSSPEAVIVNFSSRTILTDASIPVISPDNQTPISLPANSGFGGDAEGDRISNVENLQGSIFDDVLVASDSDSGYIDGLQGDDVIFAGSQADTLIGGAGIDWLSYQLSDTGVSFSLESKSGSGGYAQGDKVELVQNEQGGEFAETAFENLEGTRFDDSQLEGNALNNIIRGLAGNDNLQGQKGNDTLNGGLGADTLNGGEGLDVASYEQANSPVKVDLANFQDNAGEAAGDEYISIEGVIGTNFDDTLTGDNEDNILVGLKGIDRLSGRGGNDTLEGGKGADTLDGGEGIDLVSYARAK